MLNFLNPFSWFSTDTTGTVGGGAPDDSKAPWYVTPIVVVLVVVVAIYAGKKVVDKVIH
jgi:hypothetical protein